MRFYSFTNYYLSSIQIGIQTAHALGEMVPLGIPQPGSPAAAFREWLTEHKTMVLLNGGNSHDLRELWTLLTDERNTEFPVSKFHEDEQSLDGAITCVAIVLPERLYEAEWVKNRWSNDPGAWCDPTGLPIEGWEAELLNVIKKLPLAQ